MHKFPMIWWILEVQTGCNRGLRCILGRCWKCVNASISPISICNLYSSDGIAQYQSIEKATHSRKITLTLFIVLCLIKEKWENRSSYPQAYNQIHTEFLQRLSDPWVVQPLNDVCGWGSIDLYRWQSGMSCSLWKWYTFGLPQILKNYSFICLC